MISKYDINQDSGAIYKNMYTNCKVAQLKKAATHLNEGKPVENLTKPNITNWIITRIENYLPETCVVCDQSYHVVFGDKPAMECFICARYT